MLASGTLVSRVLGFVNALLLYNTIGTVGEGADAFALANQLPNNIFTLIAGGTLTAVIVPAIVKATGHADGGARFLNKLVTLGITIFLVVTAIVTIAAPIIVHLYAQGGDPDAGEAGRGFTEAQLQLAYAFAYFCLPQVFFYAVFAILSEVLNARGVFWPFAWAPVINNLVFVSVLLGFRAAFGSADGLPASAWTPEMITTLAGGATLGIAIQAVVLMLAWRQAGIRFRPDFRWRDAGLGKFGRLAAWTFGAMLVAQAGGIVESRVVSLASGEDASLATMSLASLIAVLPYSLITMSIAVPYFTRLSGHARDGDIKAIGGDLTNAILAVLVLQVFAAVGLAVLSPWVATLFTASPEGRVAVALVLSCTLIGLIPSSISGVLLRGWYSLDDTRAAFILQCIQVGLHVVVLLAIIAQAPRAMIAPLAALSLAGAMIINAAISLGWMRRRIPTLRVPRILGRLVWYLLAMVPAAAAGYGVEWLMREAGFARFPDGDIVGALLTAAAGGVAMLAVYLGLLVASRNPEILSITRPLLARLSRRTE